MVMNSDIRIFWSLVPLFRNLISTSDVDINLADAIDIFGGRSWSGDTLTEAVELLSVLGGIAIITSVTPGVKLPLPETSMVAAGTSVASEKL
jgi:hypothetical protein